MVKELIEETPEQIWIVSDIYTNMEKEQKPGFKLGFMKVCASIGTKLMFSLSFI